MSYLRDANEDTKTHGVALRRVPHSGHTDSNRSGPNRSKQSRRVVPRRIPMIPATTTPLRTNHVPHPRMALGTLLRTQTIQRAWPRHPCSTPPRPPNLIMRQGLSTRIPPQRGNHQGQRPTAGHRADLAPVRTAPLRSPGLYRIGQPRGGDAHNATPTPLLRI